MTALLIIIGLAACVGFVVLLLCAVAKDDNAKPHKEFNE